MQTFIANLPETVAYVTSAPYFWLSMGIAASMAIFIGAIIYDGKMKELSKGLISLTAYVFLLLQIIVTRVSANYTQLHAALREEQIYANVVSVLLLTIFFVVGLCIGICVSSRFNRFEKYHK